MSKIQVTVSIVNFQNYSYLKRCLMSIKKYTKGLSYEVIVVDNSTTLAEIKKIKKSFKGYKFIPKRKNIFFTKANNVSLKNAKGEYFLMMAPDSYLKDNSIKKLFDYMQNHKDVGAVEGLEIYENGQLVPNGSRHVTPLVDFFELSFIGKKFRNKKILQNFRIKNKNRKDTFEIDVGCDAFLMIKTALFKKIKGYDERLSLYYTENDICMRVQKQGFKIIHFGSAFIYHTVSLSANKLKWRKLDIYYKDMKNYYSKNGQIFYGYVLYSLLTVEKNILKVFRPNMFEQ